MSSNPKQLVIELEKRREAVGRIVSTRESLLLLAHDLSTAFQQLPESATSSQAEWRHGRRGACSKLSQALPYIFGSAAARAAASCLGPTARTDITRVILKPFQLKELRSAIR